MDMPTDRAALRMRFGDRYRTVAETRIVAMLMLAGWADEPDDAAAAAQAQATLGGWVERGLPCRAAANGARRFDPVEVWCRLKQGGGSRTGRDRYFRDRHVASGRRLVGDLARSPARDGPFAVELRRTFETAHLTPGAPLRLRLPLPLEQVHGNCAVEILDGERDAIRRADRLERRCAASGAPVTLGARIGFTAPGPVVGDENAEFYLRPRDGAVVVTARIAELARRLAGPGAAVAEAARAFWLYLIERFLCVPVHYDQVDAAAPCDWVLDAGCYDCRLGAALFVALCRARGIPARLIGGHVLYRRAPANHFWAEYRCPERGWTPVDFLGWDLSAGGDDPAWRDRFFGQVDARLVTEILPHAFTGAPGVPIPPAWHLIQTAVPGGIEIALIGIDGRPVYTDRVALLG